MSLNVNREVHDQFYRYKMPRLIAKVEGKGNGIKTVIVNMADIAKALGRPPSYPTKFFGCELGAQIQIDERNDKFIVNGSHEAPKLQDMLDGFIQKFVLCQSCGNPETVLTVVAKKNNQSISQSCKACGHWGTVDSRQKLFTYIIHHPPDDILSDQANRKEKKSRRASKRKTDKEENGAEPVENGGDSPKAESPEPTTPEQQLVITAVPDYQETDEADWSVDTSHSAMTQRMRELTDGARNLMLTDDLEKTEEQRLNIFYEYIKSLKGKDDLKGKDKEVNAEAERLDIKDKSPLILAELLLTDNMISEIKLYRLHFLRACHENKKAQKSLLGGFEILVGKIYSESLMAKVPFILKTFYDSDILDEDVILQWGKKVSKRYVRKEVSQAIHEKAEPFIKWLTEADEESDESEEGGDDDDDDDEESDNTTDDHHAGVEVYPKSDAIMKPIPNNNTHEADNEEDEEDDDDEFDIDAI